MRKSLVRVLAVACLLAAGVSASAPALAQPTPKNDIRTPIVTEVPIPVPDTSQVPGSNAERIADYLTSGRVEDLAQYIGIIYNFLISIVGMVAAVAMIIGGFQYLTSAGDSGKIGAAKSRMANALIGLVLALGAYTILNTINPRLLQLKLPDMRPVSTELFTLPNCEDIKVPVTPYGSGTECGFAGKYMQGNTEQVCIYAGTCRMVLATDDEKFGHKTCVQKGGMETTKAKAALAKDPNTKFAECLACHSLTKAKVKAMEFSSVQTACEAWQNAFTLVPSSLKTYTRKAGGVEYTVKDGLFYGCYPDEKNTKCLGIPLFCWDITRDDDTFNDNEGWVGNGCQGYDENPSVLSGEDLDANGFSTTIRQRRNCTGPISALGLAVVDEGDLIGLECYPVHLGNVCASNPCADFVDPSNGRRPFKDGCKNASGTAFALQRVVRHGDVGAVNDCRCAAKDKEFGCT